jgi:uncharacterized protein
MRDIFSKTHNYIKGLSLMKFIPLALISTYLILIPLIPLYSWYQNNIGNMGGFTTDNTVIDMFAAIIIAPMLETLFFQLGIIRLGEDSFKIKNKYILVFISALLFGLSHWYSILYILHGFIIGLILAYSFILYDDSKYSAFWIVTTIHALRNLLSIIFLFFL